MRRGALANGRLRPGKTILDSSSGNAGIAYAMVGRIIGYPVEIVIPDNASTERKKRLLAHGARLTYTDALKGYDEALREVHRRHDADAENYFFCDQYSNEDNWRAHYETTAVEILEQTGGRRRHLVRGGGAGRRGAGAGRAGGGARPGGRRWVCHPGGVPRDRRAQAARAWGYRSRDPRRGGHRRTDTGHQRGCLRDVRQASPGRIFRGPGVRGPHGGRCTGRSARASGRLRPHAGELTFPPGAGERDVSCPCSAAWENATSPPASGTDPAAVSDCH